VCSVHGEPLHQLRVVVDSPEHGLAADVTFTSRSAPIEEPHFFLRAGQRVVFDYTRLTQFGSWAGWVEIDGERIQLGQVELPVLGSRDRSWGVRPVGEPAPLGAPVMEPQFFWLWAPVNFPTLSTHFDVNERGDGTRWHQVGALAPLGSAAALVDTIEWSVSWRPGSRWADHFEYRLVDQNGGSHTVRLTPRYEFMMSGLGYGHPSRGHGVWQGEEVIAGERMMLPVATPCDRQHVHVQALCDATYSGPCGESEQGVGILEQLAIGPHPSGLNGVLEPYAPTLRCDERSYHHRQE
jgi:hypothetical protein